MSEEPKPTIKVKDLYDHIMKHMTAEEALMKLLGSATQSYEKLKFDEGKEVHPLLIISMATFELGWGLILEKAETSQHVRGLIVGNEEYLNETMDLMRDGRESRK